MTQESVAKMLAIMRAAWPRFYAQQTSDADAMTSARIWFGVLKDEEESIVLAALDDCVRTSPYPPVPADICTRIQAIRSVDDPSAEDEFALLAKAAKRALYNSEEEFDKLPASCKEFVGSHNGLHDMAMMDVDTIQTVMRGQFMKRYSAMKERARLRDSLPESVMALVTGVTKALPDAYEGEVP